MALGTNITLPSGQRVTLADWREESTYETIDTGHVFQRRASILGAALDMLTAVQRNGAACREHTGDVADLRARIYAAVKRRPNGSYRSFRVPQGIRCTNVCAFAVIVARLYYDYDRSGPVRHGRWQPLAADDSRLWNNTHALTGLARTAASLGVDTTAIMLRWRMFDDLDWQKPYSVNDEIVRAAYAAWNAGYEDTAREILANDAA